MTRFAGSMLLGLALVSYFGGVLAADDAKEPTQTPVPVMREAASEEGVSVRIELAKSVYAPLESVDLQVTIINASPQPIKVNRTYSFKAAQPEVVNTVNSKKVPFTLYGKWLAGYESVSSSTRTLAPGEQVRNVSPLTRIFDLSLSGDYAVSCSQIYYSVGDRKTHLVKVQDLGFSVKEAFEMTAPPPPSVPSERVMESEDENTDEAIVQRLARTHINMTLDRAPLTKVANTLSALGRIPMIIDARAKSDGKPLDEVKVTQQANDIPLGEFLLKVLQPLGLKYTIAEEMLFITDVGGVDVVMDPQVPEKARKRLSAFRLNLRLEGTSLEKAMGAIAKLIGFEIELGAVKDATIKTKVNCMCYNVSAISLLNWVCRVNDLMWTVDEGKIVIRGRKAEE